MSAKQNRIDLADEIMRQARKRDAAHVYMIVMQEYAESFLGDSVPVEAVERMLNDFEDCLTGKISPEEAIRRAKENCDWY